MNGRHIWNMHPYPSHVFHRDKYLSCNFIVSTNKPQIHINIQHFFTRNLWPPAYLNRIYLMMKENHKYTNQKYLYFWLNHSGYCVSLHSGWRLTQYNYLNAMVNTHDEIDVKSASQRVKPIKSYIQMSPNFQNFSMMYCLDSNALLWVYTLRLLTHFAKKNGKSICRSEAVWSDVHRTFSCFCKNVLLLYFFWFSL